MSDTRCDLMNWMIYPLVLIVVLALSIPDFPELIVLWIYGVFITLAHIHFGICVVSIEFYFLKLSLKYSWE